MATINLEQQSLNTTTIDLTQPMQTSQITVIPYKSEIRHIYHLSDIHIHLYKRHREYELVFGKVLDYLREERKVNKIKANSKRDISMICVITGDILHSKSDLSPECIALTYKFLKDLLDLLPVVVIPGNHDLNMNNKERLDSLTPIICDLPQHYPIHYLNKTGCWLMGNLLFSHASIFDYHIINPAWIDTELSTIRSLVAQTKDPLPERIHKVALYHGRVNGAQLFNGLGIDGEQDQIAKRTITPSSFDGYDLALLGDIHKQQFLDPIRCTRGYAGSLIQQNLGEDLTGHGLVKWTLGALGTNSACGQFIPIPNDFGYMTFRLVGGRNDYDIRVATITSSGATIPQNLRVRVLYTNTIQSQVQEFIDWLGTKHIIIEYSCQNDEPSTSAQQQPITAATTQTNPDGEPVTQREFDINNVEYQNQLLEEIIRDNFASRLADGDLETIKTLNRDANRLFNDSSEEEIDRRITLPGQRFKLLHLEFDNLFSYGENNIIDFSRCKGVVGIVAANHMGKSAILDIILYGLFDKFTRKGNIKDMINNRKSSYRVKLIVQSGIWKYTITKSGKKTAAGTGKNECTFTRQNMSSGREENLAKDTAKRTRDYICEVFGNFEDMINTNFSIQTNSTGFIDADNSERRAELEKILRFDFLTDLAKQAGKQYNDAKSIFEHLQKTMPADRINTVMTTISDNERQLIEAGEQREKMVAELAGRQTQINTLHKNLNPDADARLDNLLTDVDMTKESLTVDSNGGGSAAAILNQVSILDTEKAKLWADLDAKLEDIIIRCQNPMLGLTSNDLTQLNLAEEDKTSSKSVKRWRDQVKQQVKKCQNSARESMRESEESARSVGVQISQKRQTLVRYSVAKPSWGQAEFTAGIQSLEQKKSCLAVSNDELAAKQDELEKQQEKCDKYRRVIEDTRSDLDQLQSREQIPEFLKAEYLGSTETQTGLTNQITELEQDLSVGYPSIKPALLQLGWLNELGTRVRASTKADEKAAKYRTRIDENKAKLDKADKRVKSLGREISDSQKLQVEYQKLERELTALQQDQDAFNSNQTILAEIQEMELQEQKYKADSLKDPRLGLCDEITLALTEYSDLDARYKDTKTKLKALGGIQGEIDELLAAVERNNTINAEIVQELTTVKSLTTSISELDIRMERYKDTISGLRGQLEKMREDCAVKIQKEKLMNIYSVYRDALKLVPMVLISKVQPVIERKVNDLLSTITDFSVKFAMEDNKIDIYLDRAVYAGEPILINNSSGFERFISSLAIRIALLEISQLPSPNFIAIDEGWSCFDNENIANMDVILGHLGQKFDFILTISHLQVIRQHCDIQITLRRTDAGFSLVNYK